VNHSISQTATSFFNSLLGKIESTVVCDLGHSGFARIDVQRSIAG
jgi:hypothetical protein